MKPIQFIHGAGAILLSAALLLPACSSDDSSSTPANTLVITEANATSTVQGTTLITALLITLIEDAANSGSGACNISGSVTINNNFSTNGTVETNTGTITANSCEDSPGVIINGSVSYSFTENLSTGADSVTVSGGLTLNDNGDISTISGLSFAETSDGAGNYTTSKISFTVSSAGETFSAALTAPIVGNDADICPTTGGVQVNGGGGAQVRATLINVGSQVTIELNPGTGVFAEIANSPVACQTIFF